ncbi:DUF7311 family protein [Halosimplex sp. J119]
MVRVAFTVALLVAVAGVVVPAVEYAGVQRSDTAVRDAIDRLVGEARALDAGNDALPADTAPARRAVELVLPTEGFASAGVERFRIEGPAERSGATGSGEASRRDRPSAAVTRFTWRVSGGTDHAVVVDGVRIRPHEDQPLRLRGGQARAVLRLVDEDGTAVVRVRREG